MSAWQVDACALTMMSYADKKSGPWSGEDYVP